MNSIQPGQTPSITKQGDAVLPEESGLKFRLPLTREEHHTLCQNGDLAVLLAEIDQEDQPAERESFYIATIKLTHTDHPQVAIEVGTRYIMEYYRTDKPFGPGHRPDGHILKLLVLLFDRFQNESDKSYASNREFALWVCKFALAFGVSDGTKKGFQGRLDALEKETMTRENQRHEQEEKIKELDAAIQELKTTLLEQQSTIAFLQQRLAEERPYQVNQYPAVQSNPNSDQHIPPFRPGEIIC